MSDPALKSDARIHYERQLLRLKRVIVRMPTGVPDVLVDAPIAKYFGQEPVVDPAEGPYMCLNQAWDRTFQRPVDEKKALVVKGRYGLSLIIPFVEKIAAMPSIELNGMIHIVGERLKQLADFLEEESVQSYSLVKWSWLIIINRFKNYPTGGSQWEKFDGTEHVLALPKQKQKHGEVKEKARPNTKGNKKKGAPCSTDLAPPSSNVNDKPKEKQASAKRKVKFRHLVRNRSLLMLHIYSSLPLSPHMWMSRLKSKRYVYCLHTI